MEVRAALERLEVARAMKAKADLDYSRPGGASARFLF
jgi:hypothetical protein